MERPTTRTRDDTPELRARSELRAGEQLLWFGQPDPKRYGWNAGFTWLKLGIGVTAFMTLWSGTVVALERWQMALFASPIVIVGLCMLAYPLWLRRQAPHVIYAITSERVLILNEERSRSVALGHVDLLERRDRPDGSGDLCFAKERIQDSDGCTHIREIGFIGVQQVREVEAILQRAQQMNAGEPQRPSVEPGMSLD